MTETGKEIIRLYYGRMESYSYFLGGSTGGQQALSEAQRFPFDYDGILAMSPANNRVFLHIYFLWNHNHLRPRSGRMLFSQKEIMQISDCAIDYFQSKGDGLTGDPFVSFPYTGNNTVEDFLLFLHQKYPLFTEVQLQALSAVYHGPVNQVTGEQIYCGMPIGSEIYSCGIAECQQEESPHFYPFIWAFGPDYDGYQFDLGKDVEKIDALLSADLNANQPDLHAFSDNGGKLILISGSADPCVPFPDAMNYYKRVIQAMGSRQKTDGFLRYFLIPGKDHGMNGRGCSAIWGPGKEKEELLDVLRRWREQKKEPEYLVSVKEDPVTKDRILTRKVYPYGSFWQNEEVFPKTCSSRYLEENH